MTNHPHRSKKAWSTVRVSAKDAYELAGMMELLSGHARDRAGEIARLTVPSEDRERIDRSIRSWDRASRKAKSFALQFKDIALEAENGMASGTRQLR